MTYVHCHLLSLPLSPSLYLSLFPYVLSLLSIIPPLSFTPLSFQINNFSSIIPTYVIPRSISSSLHLFLYRYCTSTVTWTWTCQCPPSLGHCTRDPRLYIFLVLSFISLITLLFIFVVLYSHQILLLFSSFKIRLTSKFFRFSSRR